MPPRLDKLTRIDRLYFEVATLNADGFFRGFLKKYPETFNCEHYHTPEMIQKRLAEAIFLSSLLPRHYTITFVKAVPPVGNVSRSEVHTLRTGTVTWSLWAEFADQRGVACYFAKTEAQQ
ncbi:MAG: hypothetical protein HZA34_02260 [Candidatus Pacebacteria bacterium]|nr:hypothetical protein [Candidatus Paceibacterota bacterium]